MLSQQRNVANIPYQVNINDLDASGRLFADKSDTININNEPHAIYTSQQSIARNGRTIVRIAQNLHSGLWEVCKTIDHRMFNPIEIEATQQLEQFVSFTDSMLFLKYVRGVRLDALLAQATTYPSQLYLEIAIQLLLFIQALHYKNFAHQDLHGGNILYDIATNKLTVIDFGRAIRTNAIAEKKPDLERIMWHLHTCLRQTAWLKENASYVFKDIYSHLTMMKSRRDIDYFHLNLQKRLRFLKRSLKTVTPASAGITRDKLTQLTVDQRFAVTVLA